MIKSGLYDVPYTALVDTNDPEHYSFGASGLIPIIVNAIKELDAENQELRARIEALENKQ